MSEYNCTLKQFVGLVIDNEKVLNPKDFLQFDTVYDMEEAVRNTVMTKLDINKETTEITDMDNDLYIPTKFYAEWAKLKIEQDGPSSILDC